MWELPSDLSREEGLTLTQLRERTSKQHGGRWRSFDCRKRENLKSIKSAIFMDNTILNIDLLSIDTCVIWHILPYFKLMLHYSKSPCSCIKTTAASDYNYKTINQLLLVSISLRAWLRSLQLSRGTGTSQLFHFIMHNTYLYLILFPESSLPTWVTRPRVNRLLEAPIGFSVY